MGGQTNNGQLPTFAGTKKNFIKAKRLQKRMVFEKQQQLRFQQADEFSALSQDAGQDLNVIAGDDYFTQKAKRAKQAKNRKFEQAKLTAEQRAFQSTRGAAQPFLVVQVRI